MQPRQNLQHTHHPQQHRQRQCINRPPRPRRITKHRPLPQHKPTNLHLHSINHTKDISRVDVAAAEDADEDVAAAEDVVATKDRAAVAIKDKDVDTKPRRSSSRTSSREDSTPTSARPIIRSIMQTGTTAGPTDTMLQTTTTVETARGQHTDMCTLPPVTIRAEVARRVYTRISSLRACEG
eukprot:scaffold191518_cov40-Cyclotella_meneghiniana.AAC.1